MYKVKIIGIGSYVPPKVLTNFDLEKMVDTSDEWIIQRTGIRERRIADENVCTSDLATEAAKIAIYNAGISVSDIDAIIVATASPDNIYPATACWVQKKLDASVDIPSFDILAGCSGFLYALDIASSMIDAGNYKYVLVCGAEVMSKIVDWQDRNTCVLFGDGASCCVVTKSEDDGCILSSYLGSDGRLGELLIQPAGGTRIPTSKETVEKRLHYVHMQGREVFKHAVRRMEESVREALRRANLSIKDIDLFIAHQANYRIVEETCYRVNIPLEKTHIIIEKYGNVPAASIPLTLDDAIKCGKVKRGDLILFAAFGAGFTWGGMVMRW